MLLPPLCTQLGYVKLAEEAGFTMLAPPKDISQEVRKTWSVNLVLTTVESCADGFSGTSLGR